MFSFTSPMKGRLILTRFQIQYGNSAILCCLLKRGFVSCFLFLIVIFFWFIYKKAQQHATQDQIAYFGQTPSQLLVVPHLKRMPLADVLHLQVWIWLFKSDTVVEACNSLMSMYKSEFMFQFIFYLAFCSPCILWFSVW